MLVGGEGGKFGGLGSILPEREQFSWRGVVWGGLQEKSPKIPEKVYKNLRRSENLYFWKFSGIFLELSADPQEDFLLPAKSKRGRQKGDGKKFVINCRKMSQNVL